MFCQIATGSLLLSAIGVLPALTTRCFAPAFWLIPHRCGGPVNIAAVDLSAPPRKAFCGAENRVIEFRIAIPLRGNSQGELASAHQPPQIARANGIDLCYEIFGDADAEPMLLIMGLGAQMIHWDDDFCRQLAARGFRVIRFDNRDIGKSSQLSGGKRLTPIELLKLRFLKIPVAAPYKTARHGAGHDRADGCARHQVGASGRRIDGRHDRPGNRDLVSAAGALADLDHVDDRQSKNAAADPRGHRHADGAAADHARTNISSASRRPGRCCASAAFREDEALDRSRAERTFERGLNPAGVGRQLRAILASGSRKERLRAVKAPTLVIHGTVDPLVRPEGGKDTAASIPGAKLLMIEGMGHALPIPMWPQIIDAIDQHAHAAAAKASIRPSAISTPGGRHETGRRMLLRPGALPGRGRADAEGAVPLPRMPVYQRRLAEPVHADADRWLQLHQGHAEEIYAQRSRTRRDAGILRRMRHAIW